MYRIKLYKSARSVIFNNENNRTDEHFVVIKRNPNVNGWNGEYNIVIQFDPLAMFRTMNIKMHKTFFLCVVEIKLNREYKLLFNSLFLYSRIILEIIMIRLYKTIILSVILYGCENEYLTITEHRLMAFLKRVS